ncbi:MAG: hypothetical protein AAGE79_09540 [Acinetobacter pittii]
MRREDINDLLEESNEILKLIISYHKVPKAKVKSIFEHLRSTLEYLANDINDQISKPTKGNLYFPYGKNEGIFNNRIKQHFPLLKNEFPDIYDELLNFQDFKTNDDWLCKLCDLVNNVKHNNAINVKHEQGQLINFFAGDYNIVEMVNSNVADVRIEGLTVNGKKVDDFTFNKNGEMLITKKGELTVDFKVTRDKKILIGDELLDLIPFFNKCIKKITAFVDKIYFLLENYKKG